MERIKLSKDEKYILRLLNDGMHNRPCNMNQKEYIGLKRKGLAYCHQEENGDILATSISNAGKMYLCANPSLHCPIDWEWAISFVALFIVCSLKYNTLT